MAHWTIPQTKAMKTMKKKSPTTLVYQASTGEIRRLWQEINQQARSLPSPRPPLSMTPALSMSDHHWQLFWKLNIPHGARNCWWRLLIRKLPTRNNLRHFSGEPPTCQLCNQETEDDYHMIFNCPRKKSFWLVAKAVAKIDVELDDVWDILTFQKSVDKKIMIRIGEILMVTWQLHWQCSMNNVPWSTTFALRHLRRLHWVAGLE
jgi:hypothetical protein